MFKLKNQVVLSWKQVIIIKIFLHFCTKSLQKLLFPPSLDWLTGEGNESYQKCYKSLFFVEKDEQVNDWKFRLALHCLDPAIGFNIIMKSKPRTIILTSGTMSPLNSFESELGIKFDIKLSNQHVIDTKNQLKTYIVKSGIGYNKIDFSYKGENQKSRAEFAKSIFEIIKLVPNGILICFSSYQLLERCWNEIEKSKLMNQLMQMKSIYKEPKDAMEFEKTIKAYKASSQKRGAVLFCVMRGKSSEGIDFNDEFARAMIVVGIPLPSIADFYISSKMRYLDSKEGSELKKDAWYHQQAIRAYNQAIGRIIRHKDDYGLIFLFEQRYDSIEFKSGLPFWIKDNLASVSGHEEFKQMMQEMRTFYKNRFLIENSQMNLGMGQQAMDMTIPMPQITQDGGEPMDGEDGNIQGISNLSTQANSKIRHQNQDSEFEVKRMEQLKKVKIDQDTMDNEQTLEVKFDYENEGVQENNKN